MLDTITAEYKFVITVILMAVITVLSVLFGFIVGASYMSFVDKEIISECTQNLDAAETLLNNCTL